MGSLELKDPSSVSDEPQPEVRFRADDLKLLAIGDVHLGTRPSRLPADLRELGLDPRALTPEAALASAVDRAIDERVEGVLFAGDVVESTNARFEALRPLESAVGRLREAGIAVIGVGGNHDVEALPRLARMIEGFELLGQGGRWESRRIEKSGHPGVEVLGWSFPEKRVRSSPVAELIRNPVIPLVEGVPRFGLLHGDLDASGGDYAPFTSRELGEAGLDAWLLGHIHKPSLAENPRDGQPLRGYLGSLTGLDPGEFGQRGPWLIRVSTLGEVHAQHLATAPLRFERRDLRVGEDESVDDIADRLLEEASAIAREVQADSQATSGGGLQALGVRLRLVGQTQHYESLNKWLETGKWHGCNRWLDEVFVFVEKLSESLELSRDLHELARGDDPLALLARQLLILQEPGASRRALLEEARAQLRPLAEEPRWSPLEDERDSSDPLEEEALAAQLSKSGIAALNMLLCQRESGPAEAAR